MKTLLSILGLAITFGASAAWLYAAPTIGIVSVTPASVPVNSSTTITVTATIDGPSLLTQSVELVRVSGATSTIVGALHDDGQNGDVAAGDHIYTAQISLKEYEPGTIQLEVSAAFQGFLRRVTASVPPLAVYGLELSQVAGRDLIVDGTVISVTSYYSGSSILSDIQLQNASSIRGTLPSSTMIVTIGGGTVLGVTQQGLLEGTVVPGQELILFLNGPNADNKYTVPDGPLGVFYIQSDSSSGKIAIIDPGYTSVDLVAPLDPTYAALLAESAQHALPLSSLLAALSAQ